VLVFATFKANLWQSQRVCLCLPAKVGDGRWAMGGWLDFPRVLDAEKLGKAMGNGRRVTLLLEML